MFRTTHALVTGASSGLSPETVRQLAGDPGLTVLATARRLDRLEALAAELPAGCVHVLAGDLADASFRNRLWERAMAFPGGLDLLVNNAGVGHYDDFVNQDSERIRQIIELNLVALIDLTQKAARHSRAPEELAEPELLAVSSRHDPRVWLVPCMGSFTARRK